MKIALSYKSNKGSWGGGNQFVKSLVKIASEEGHEFVYDLKHKDIDIILLTDPRSYNQEITFGPFDIFNYLIIC